MFKKHKQPPMPARRPLSSASRNAPVFSYYNNRSALETNTGRNQPSHNAAQRKRFDLGNVPAVLASMVIIGCMVYAGTLQATPRVVTVDDGHDGVAKSTDVYQRYAESIMRSSLWHYGKLTVDTDDISAHMREHFPELTQASVSIPLISRTPVITLRTTKPAYILTSGTSAYYIGANGKALAQVATAQAVPEDTLTVRDESGTVLEAGKQILPADNVAFINAVVFQLRAKQMNIEHLTLPAVPYELRVKLKETPYYVKFDMLGDPRVQAGTFLAVQAKLAGDKVTPKEYIDVRVDERAFYK